MNTYQQLCQQHQHFQQKQQSKLQLLQTEMEGFRQHLAETLDLKDKRYCQHFTDTEPTMPYVSIKNISINQDNLDLPVVIFDLEVVLEDAPDIYPKYPFEQSIRVGFIQADRVYFNFLKHRPELRFSVNLHDSEPVKYRALTESYIALLMKRLSR